MTDSHKLKIKNLKKFRFIQVKRLNQKIYKPMYSTKISLMCFKTIDAFS